MDLIHLTFPHFGSQQGLSRASAQTRLLWGFAILLLLPACVAIAAIVYVHSQLVQSESYQESVSRAISSPEVQSALGNKISVPSRLDLSFLSRIRTSRNGQCP